MTSISAGKDPPSRSPPPRSYPRQNASQQATRGGAHEPAFKKQKLEHNARNLGLAQTEVEATRGATSSNSPLQPSNAQPAWTGASGNQPGFSRSPLFPSRPSEDSGNTVSGQARPLAIERATVKHTVPVKPYVPEAPTFAPQYQNSDPADFFPWIGRHPEDALGEIATRNGYYDKIQVSQNESSTARPSIWSSVKHKSGLQILSSLFVSALDQRQKHGTTCTASTFKPPPRVTLTDTKREAWLRDLANPSIPLRRLSRTIPHGIRGKILLDHCLSKNIPATRGIWLVKCVGANEIRAFKRKCAGNVFTIGGETKWIKDWTSNVEQFLESVISRCGSAGWKTEVEYSLGLTSQLYSEHLLDRYHYLNWLITSFVDSDLENLPVWLLLLQIHWQEVLQHRQQARRMAEAVLKHLLQAYTPSSRDIYRTVSQQLVNTVKTMMTSVPACFLLPHCWNDYESLLQEIVATEDSSCQFRFKDLTRRNSILQQFSSQPRAEPQRSSSQCIVAILDEMLIGADFATTAGLCLRTAQNHDVLITACLEWSSSIYRHGSYRPYAAARLLRLWNKHGIDIQTPIHNFLVSNRDSREWHKPDLYRLIADIVCSKHFSVGRYLQWLLASGTLQGAQKPDPDGPCHVRLLFELPLHSLPTPAINLRRSLLRSLEASVEEEENDIQCTKATIARQIPSLFSFTDFSEKEGNESHGYASLSQTIKSAVGRWIRQTLISRRQRASTKNSEAINAVRSSTKETHSNPLPLDLEQYRSVRNVLEDLSEFAILADVLDIMISETVLGSMLTDVSDTVNYHFDVFRAIGAADDLFHRIYTHVKDSNDHGLVERQSIESLIDLGCRLPDTDQDVRDMRKQLLTFGPKLSAAAFSPISDTMVEAVQTTEPTFIGEMDQILSSGTSMDKQTLTRVFETITEQLEKSWDDPNQSVVRLPELLRRLKPFDPKLFQILVSDWARRILRFGATPNLSMILQPLICVKVISLKSIVVLTLGLLNEKRQSDNKPVRATLTIDILDMLTEGVTERMPTADCRIYRLVDQKRHILSSSPEALLQILHSVTQACTTADPSVRARAKLMLQKRQVRTVTQQVLLEPIDSSQELVSVQGTQDSVAKELFQVHPNDVLRLGLREQLSQLLDGVNDFNVRLRQFALKATIGSTDQSLESPADVLAEVVIEKLRSPTDAPTKLWAFVISHLANDQAAAFRRKTESELVLGTLQESTQRPDKSEALRVALFSVVEATAFSISDSESSPVIEQVSERFATIPLELRLEGNKLEKPHDTINTREHINVLLRLLTIHQTIFQQPKHSQDTLCHLLLNLSLLLVHESLIPHPNTTDHIFDVLTLLSDFLTEDSRCRCIRTLRDHHRTRDPRLRFIFGYSETADSEWLQLVTKPSAPSDANKAEGLPQSTAFAQPYPLRPWEMMQDATPVVTENDTSLSLTLFGARKSVL